MIHLVISVPGDGEIRIRAFDSYHLASRNFAAVKRARPTETHLLAPALDTHQPRKPRHATRNRRPQKESPS